MPEHVIATDPGGRSGWASAWMSEDRLVMSGTGVLRQDLLDDWFAEQQGVIGIPYKRSMVRQRLYDVFVYESWYPRPDDRGSMQWIQGNELDEAQHIGALKFIARTSGMKIVTQHPSDKDMATATMPESLRRLDEDSTEQHDQDARMHLWLYFWRNWFSATVDPESVIA